MTTPPNVGRVSAKDVVLVVSTFSKNDDAEPHEQSGTLGEIFGEHEDIGATARSQLPGFSTARFREGGSRRSFDMIDSAALVLDVDGVSEQQAAQLFRSLGDADLAFGAYTTLRHDEEQPRGHRYRVVLPFARSANAQEVRATFLKLKLLVKVPLDESGKDPVHRWTFPFRRSNTQSAMWFTEGQLLEPEPAPALVPPSHASRAAIPMTFDPPSLAAWLVAHRSPNAELQQATLAIINGEDWGDGDRGSRDSLLWATLASIALRAPGLTVDILSDLIEPAVQSAMAAGSKVTMKIARDKIRRAIEQAERTPRFVRAPSTSTKTVGPRPRRVRVATFVLTTLDRTEKATMPGSELRARYLAWAAQNGGSAHWKFFSAELKRLGITSRKVRGKTMWPLIAKANPLPGPGPYLVNGS